MTINKKICTRPVGSLDVSLTELGFGGASLGNLYKAVSDEEAVHVLDSALRVGMNYFDVAPYYGFGLSERRIGDLLRTQAPGSYVLSTKVGRLLRPEGGLPIDQLRHGFISPMPFSPVYDYSYDGVMRSFEDSLQRMGLSQIDILYMHDIGGLTHGAQHSELFKQAMEGGYRALDLLRASGAIRAIGLGVNEWEVCEQAMRHGQFDCFLLAGRYTLLEQGALASFFPRCRQHGATVVLGGVYNSGILASGVNTQATPYYDYEPAPRHIIERVRRIEEICTAYHVSLPAAAIQFVLAHPLISSVVVGMGSAARVEGLLTLYEEKIPDTFWQALRDADLLDEQAPLPSVA